MEANKVLTSQKCGFKVKSKKEMYRLLVTDGKLYLLPIRLVNHKYIRNILTEKKLVSEFTAK